MTAPVPSSVLAARIQVFALTLDSPVKWRLLSGNNREVARSVADFRDRESCLLALKQTQVQAGEFARAVRRTEQGEWWWTLLDGPEAVVRSAHTFVRQIRCERGMEQFLASIVDADVSAETLVSHSRRWEQRIVRLPVSAVAPPRLR